MDLRPDASWTHGLDAALTAARLGALAVLALVLHRGARRRRDLDRRIARLLAGLASDSPRRRGGGARVIPFPAQRRAKARASSKD